MIIFERIKLNNFRRYVDCEFNFSNDYKNNVNVILARNGTGKSTLFDAITWCLFGEEDHLQIDSKYKEDSETILNSEIGFNLTQGDSIDVSVELSVTDSNTNNKYLIKRVSRFTIFNDGRLLYNKEENRIAPEVLSFDTKYNDWRKEDKPTLIIENLIVPKDLRHFFFFDGERLGKHFEENSSDFIKKKVEQVSRLGRIDNSINSINLYLHSLNSKQKSLVSDKNLKRKIDERDILLEKQQKYQEDLNLTLNLQKEANKNLDKCRKEVEEIGFNHNNVSVLNRSLSITCKRVDDIKQEIEKLEDEFNEKISDYFLKNIFSSIIEKSNDIIYKATENKEIPPPITRDYIDKILERKECICGACLDKDSKYRHNLEKFKEETELINTSIDFNKGQFYFEKQIDLISKKEYLNIKNKIKFKKDELKEEEEKREELNIKLGSLNIERIKFLQGQLEQLTSALDNLKRKEINLLRDIEDIGVELKRCENEIKKGEKDNERLNSLNNKKAYIENAKKVFTNFRKYLIMKNLQNLKQNTELYLKEILTEKKDEISEIVIDNDYNLKIMSIYNKDLTRTLSKGESQIFVMSFAAALRDLMNLKTPFLIDTPLGRIDNEYRLEVTKSFPKILENSQFILLVTSSEYTGDVKEILKKISNNKLVEYEVMKEGNKNKLIKNE